MKPGPQSPWLFVQEIVLFLTLCDSEFGISPSFEKASLPSPTPRREVDSVDAWVVGKLCRVKGRTRKLKAENLGSRTKSEVCRPHWFCHSFIRHGVSSLQQSPWVLGSTAVSKRHRHQTSVALVLMG